MGLLNKILLIDDEEAILRVLSMSLRSDGYEVLTASNGEEGISVFKEQSPQVVLTDIKMPGMDGLEVLKHIKQIDPDAEVVIITGHGDIDSAIEALQHGASDFINKPVRDKALAIALKRADEKLAIRRRLNEYTNDLETMASIATQEFERKSNFQAKLIRSSNDGIVATDEKWKIVVFNPGAEKIFGCQKLDVRDKDVRDLLPDQVVRILEERAKPDVSADESTWVDALIASKDGRKIPVRFSGVVLRERNQMMGSVAFFQDMREIKRLEKELVNSERLAAVGQTVAGMAHCIKNILHGFKGGSYLVDVGMGKNNTDKLKSGWSMIQRNIVRTSDLVMDLLSYSKEREPEFEMCRPNEIADDVCELMKEVAADYEVEIIKDFTAKDPVVRMDPRSIHRSLLNLVSNAIDACIFDDNINKDHHVILKTHVEANDVMRFEIIDNGCGMSEEVKEKLFSSFFSTKGVKGTGLGLLVTGKLVEEHNGTIKVSSVSGKGTTFEIRLPFENSE